MEHIQHLHQLIQFTVQQKPPLIHWFVVLVSNWHLKGIRVNAVCPGPTETPIFGKVGLPQEALQQMAGAIKNKIPVKRFGAPSDIAKLISFISSDNASFITGSEYVIDGGISSVPIMS